MRQFAGLLFVLLFAFPLGISVAGCGSKNAVQYCPGGSGDAGPLLGQVKTITLAQNLVVTGESLYYGQIGNALNASAVDCTGAPVSVSRYIFATTDPSIADINPATGQVCAGTWNRSSGGGVGDYTICTPPAAPAKHTALITASANGATSNSIEVFIHPPVTSVALGMASTSCNTDPASNCPASNPNLIGATLPAVPPIAYDGSFCLSQNPAATKVVPALISAANPTGTVSLSTGQLVARVYATGPNGSTTQQNITSQVGPIAFALQGNTSIASINATGVVTATQPGSALVTATVSNSSSALNAGFVSVCPPASITLTSVGSTPSSTSQTVALNTPQSFNAKVIDTLGYTMQGIALEFNSTLPVNFPANAGTVTAAFPGSANITAVCQPPTCNPAPFSQIGYLGNGVPVTSNGITVTAPGTSSDVLYMASLNSQYLVSEDFTTGQLGAPLKLPYAPTSMVISQDGSTIYMGSAGGLMTLSTATGALGGPVQTAQGTVLAVAPNNSYAVVTDPARNNVSLVTASGNVLSSYNGVGIRAQWTPDSSTLYVVTNNNQNPLLTYSTFVGWQNAAAPTTVPYNDVAVAVPAIGAFVAGNTDTDFRSYCPLTTSFNAGTPPSTTNTFTPVSATVAAPAQRLAATTDGAHILGVFLNNVGSPGTLEDIAVSYPAMSATQPFGPGACTTVGGNVTIHSSVGSHPLPAFNATAFTGIPLASDSSLAAVTYTGSGGILALYAPGASALSSIPLSGGASTAPVAGVFSTDNRTFYVGTSGDNLVHTVTIKGGTATDSGTIAPALPGVSGGTAIPNLIVIRSRRATA